MARPVAHAIAAIILPWWPSGAVNDNGSALARIADALGLNDVDDDEARALLRRAGVDPCEIEDHIAMEAP